MEPIGKIAKPRQDKPVKNRYLHSPNHLLADELSNRLSDPKHFAFYLKMATLYDHNFLRKLAGEVLESKDVHTPGRLFAFLIKKHNEETSAEKK